MNQISSSVRYFMYGIVVVVPVAVSFSDLVGFVTTITGRSMRPTFNPEPSLTDDRVWLSRWRMNNYNPRPGDVVAIRSPINSKIRMVKRVIATEGEIMKTRGYKTRYVTIPDGHIWVEGDNERSSQDSNFYGPVSKGLVCGRVMLVLWPPHRWGRVNHHTLQYQQERRFKSSENLFII